MIINVLDLGSNSFQWLVARYAGGRIERLHQSKRFARFASSVSKSGSLSETDIRSGLKLVAELQAEVAPDHRHGRPIAVATGAIRQADNGLEFIERLWLELGIDARILTGKEEGDLAFRGALGSMGPSTQAHEAVIDLGGGSLEVALGTADEHGFCDLDAVWSVQRGMLHYLDSCPKLDALALTAIGADVDAALQLEMGEHRLPRVKQAVLACGVARDLVALLETVAPDALMTGHRRPGARGVIGAQALHQALPMLARFTPEAVVALGVPEARSAILAIGATMLAAAGERLGADELVVAPGGLRDGVVWTQVHAQHLKQKAARVA